MASHTGAAFILDNGAFTVKVGNSLNGKPDIVPNCIMKAKSEKCRPFIGDQIDDCRDLAGLFYILPFQKGFMNNLEVQKKVWDYILAKESCKVDLKETPVIVTEPYFNFLAIQHTMTEMFFEEYNCQALLRINAGELSAYHHMSQMKHVICCLIVDSGYSFTYIVPYIDGVKYIQGIVRIDVGGKLLTNRLKEIISYRQIHVMEETHVVNQIKEDACYVSLNFKEDMKTAQKRFPENTIVRDYILPDYTDVRRGYVRKLDEPPIQDFQTIRLANERFTIPEVLFHPSDIGIKQMGIPEAIVHSVMLCPEQKRVHLLNNIILTGGNACFKNYKERIYDDVRKLTPADYSIRVILPKEPITYAWQGACMLSKDPEFYSHVVTKEEYEEEGFAACYEKFNV